MTVRREKAKEFLAQHRLLLDARKPGKAERFRFYRVSSLVPSHDQRTEGKCPS